MKTVTYFCETCDKEIVVTTDQPIIPSSCICTICNGQVWLRGINDGKPECKHEDFEIKEDFTLGNVWCKDCKKDVPFLLETMGPKLAAMVNEPKQLSEGKDVTGQ